MVDPANEPDPYVHWTMALPQVSVRVDLGPLPDTAPALGWPPDAGFDVVTTSSPLPTTIHTTVFRAARDCHAAKVVAPVLRHGV